MACVTGSKEETAMPAYKDKEKGTWYASFYYEDWTGKKVKKLKRGFSTKRDALEWERTFLQQQTADLEMTFENFVALYAADMKGRIKENTWGTKEHILYKKLVPYFGKRKMCDIHSKEVMAWQNEMLNYRDEKGKPYSPVYLKTLHNQLSAVFNHAVRHYNLKVNPAAQVGNMGKAKGREMLEESARRHGQDLSRIMKQEYISSILKKHNLQNAEDMYAAIGYGGISSGQVLHKLIELNRKAEKVQSIQQSLEAAAETPAGSAGILPAKKNASHGNSVIVSGDPNMAVRFGNCCNPLPGDPIVGYVTRGRGVSIHRADCKNLQSLRLDKERFLPEEWNMDDSERFSATVQLHLVDKTGSLLEISKLLTASNIYISDMSAQTSPDGVAVMRMTFMVSDTAQLNSIISSLKRLKSVIDVRRVSK